MIATSELRRSDRRGVTPRHLLYVAMRLLRIRIRDSLTIAYKHIGTNTKVTRAQIESKEYLNHCLDNNLAFYKCIPNSTWYWSQRKKDLFAMIRQLVKPTFFLTMSANEIGWPQLLTLLHKLATQERPQSIPEDIPNWHYILKSSLINNDAVTCAIYFNELVNIIMAILQSKKTSPFGEYRVLHYFKRIEFQNRGSPHAHILLWLDNAPSDPLGVDFNTTISIIDFLVSVLTAESSSQIKLQTHKHTFTCFKKDPTKQKCCFDASFMPSRRTTILIPMQKTNPNFTSCHHRYTNLKANLTTHDYTDIDDFYTRNGIQSDAEYYDILRAGIVRPRVFYKRQPSEKMHNTFNPFIFYILKSNMDIQFITEEYSVAAYVVEYVNKSDREISNLARAIKETMEKNPSFGEVDIARKLGVDMLNSFEISSQEAAWFLLREHMSKSSDSIIYVNTVWPVERERIKKTKNSLMSYVVLKIQLTFGKRIISISIKNVLKTWITLLLLNLLRFM